MAQKAKPAHYNLKLVYLKALFNWCLQEGIYSENPLLPFKKRKAEGRVVNLETDVAASASGRYLYQWRYGQRNRQTFHRLRCGVPNVHHIRQ
jgi:hypothetical protein